MAKVFMLQITTPEKLFYKNMVESLILSSPDGMIGILPEHLPMVIALAPSPIQFRTEGSGEWLVAAVSGGFARVKGTEVHILADTAEWPEEIEQNRALEAKKRAEERMRERMSEVEYIRSRAALERALSRLAAKNSRNRGV